jgi:hypothetical protein
VLITPAARITYTESDAPAARRTAAIAGAVAAEVAEKLGVAPPEPFEVVLAPSDAAFDREVARLGGRGVPPAWALAVALPDANALVVRTPRLEAFTDADLRPTLAHEVAHLALGALPERVPRWLDEGLAMWASGRTLGANERTTLERLARAKTLSSLEDIERDFPAYEDEAHLAYVESLGFVSWLAAEPDGEAHLRALVREVSAGMSFPRAFERAFGAPVHGAELVFRADTAARYSLIRDLTERGSLYTLVALLAVVAFVRYRRQRARLLAAMGEPPAPPQEYGDGDPGT